MAAKEQDEVNQVTPPVLSETHASSAKLETGSSSAKLETGFKTWIKAQMACIIARDGIKDIVLSEINEFHKTILRKVQIECEKCYTSNVLSCPTPNFCKYEQQYQERVCQYHYGNYIYINCPNKVCQKIAKAIFQEHTGRPSWKNTNAKEWCKNAFEIAKCFLPFGYTASSIDETDFYGVTCIMTMMTRFRGLFFDDISKQQNIIQKARNAANTVRHSPDLNLKYPQLENIVSTFIDMLSDPKFSKENKEAENTIKRLKELLCGNIDLNKTSVIEALESVKETDEIELSDEEKEDKITEIHYEHKTDSEMKATRIKGVVRYLKSFPEKNYLNESDLKQLENEGRSDRDDLQHENKDKESSKPEPCCICQEQKASVLSRNCGHLVTCRTCYGDLEEKRCPLCRRDITEAEFLIETGDTWQHCIDRKDEDIAWKLIHRENLPNANELEEVCSTFGDTSAIVKGILQSIEEKITAYSQSIIYTQACRLAKPLGNIIFVAFTEGIFTDIYDMPLSYRVLVRKMTERSGEANTIIEQEVADNQHFCQHDTDKIARCLRQHSPRLMKEHSNLTMTSASRYKSKYYDSPEVESEVDAEPCIVFYVLAKGLIPVGENSLPASLTIGDTKFKTDVREARVLFAVGGNPTSKHENMKLGCRIKSENGAGTIGGFVEHPKHGLCAMTCAHVLLSGKEMVNYKTGKNVHIKRDCFQPSEPEKCGELLDIKLREGNTTTTGLDIAFVKVDDKRQPISGDFPDYSWKDIEGTCGYCKDDLLKAQLAYNSGEVLSRKCFPSDKKVVKYGQKTRLTEGRLQICGGSSAPEIFLKIDGKKKRKRFVFHDQFHIFDIYHRFCAKGDSGSLLFSRGLDNTLSAIGILVGNCDIKVSFATPLSSILREIGQSDPLSLVKFDPNQRLDHKINRTYSEVKGILEKHSESIADVQNSVQELKDEMRITSGNHIEEINEIKEIKSMLKKLMTESKITTAEDTSGQQKNSNSN